MGERERRPFLSPQLSAPNQRQSAEISVPACDRPTLSTSPLPVRVEGIGSIHPGCLPMARDVPTGIDLGTTNSAVAWVDESGRSAMVPNAEGELITPSVVFFGDAEVVVGKNARTRHRRPSRHGGPMGQARHGRAVLQPSDPRPVPAARGDPGLHSPQAQGRHRPRAGARRAGGHHRAGLLRRAAAQGHGRRRARWPACACWTSSTSRRPPPWPSARRWATSPPGGLPRRK